MNPLFKQNYSLNWQAIDSSQEEIFIRAALQPGPHRPGAPTGRRKSGWNKLATCVDWKNQSPSIRYLAIFIDITDVTELREMQSQLEARPNAAVQGRHWTPPSRPAAPNQTDFLSSMSHDIRTPMNAIVA